MQTPLNGAILILKAIAKYMAENCQEEE